MIQGMWENWKIWLFKVHITMQIISFCVSLSFSLFFYPFDSITFVAVTQSHIYRSQFDDYLTLLMCHIFFIFICCSFKIEEKKHLETCLMKNWLDDLIELIVSHFFFKMTHVTEVGVLKWLLLSVRIIRWGLTLFHT